MVKSRPSHLAKCSISEDAITETVALATFCLFVFVTLCEDCGVSVFNHWLKPTRCKRSYATFCTFELCLLCTVKF
jgi:hypothetical protein